MIICKLIKILIFYTIGDKIDLLISLLLCFTRSQKLWLQWNPHSLWHCFWQFIWKRWMEILVPSLHKVGNEVVHIMLNFDNVPGASSTDKSRSQKRWRNLSSYQRDGCGILLFCLWGNELCQSTIKPMALFPHPIRCRKNHVKYSSRILALFLVPMFRYESAWGWQTLTSNNNIITIVIILMIIIIRVILEFLHVNIMIMIYWYYYFFRMWGFGKQHIEKSGISIYLSSRYGLWILCSYSTRRANGNIFRWLWCGVSPIMQVR